MAGNILRPPAGTSMRELLRIRSDSQRATEIVGERFSSILLNGDVLLLQGDVGGGKTTFVRGLLRGLGHPDPRDVASPTFALHHRYVGGRLVVDHLDLYRLLDPNPADDSTSSDEALRTALERQGILDVFGDPGGIIAVEWPSALPESPARRAFSWHFDHISESGRFLSLWANDDLVGPAEGFAALFTREPLTDGFLAPSSGSS